MPRVDERPRLVQRLQRRIAVEVHPRRQVDEVLAVEADLVDAEVLVTPLIAEEDDRFPVAGEVREVDALGPLRQRHGRSFRVCMVGQVELRGPCAIGTEEHALAVAGEDGGLVREGVDDRGRERHARRVTSLLLRRQLGGLRVGLHDGGRRWGHHRRWRRRGSRRRGGTGNKRDGEKGQELARSHGNIPSPRTSSGAMWGVRGGPKPTVAFVSGPLDRDDPLHLL